MKLPTISKIFAPSGRGSVTIIAILLLSSASLRLVLGTSEAFAQENPLPTTEVDAAQEARNVDEMATENQLSVDQLAQGSPSRDQLSALLAAITEREAQIADREKRLKMRLKALEVADAEIEKKLLALNEMEENLRATLSLSDEASEKDLVRLTSVYESMKPKEAAALFEQMEPTFAVGFLARMRPDAAASVMAGLSPEAAYSISVIFAGRNANVPKS